MRRTDELTGLLNRKSFEDEIRALRRGNVEGAFAMIDLDLFKGINDRYGHHVGDEVLRTTAHRLRDHLPASAVCSRCGGEEFGVFLRADLPSAHAVMDSMLALIRLPMTADGQLLQVTASAGLAPMSLKVELTRAWSSADAALYAAKAGGRDRVVVFDEETQAVVMHRRELAHAVHELQKERLVLREQALTDPLTGLPNRRALDNVLPSSNPAENAAAPMSVVFLDIDHFGLYNKHYSDEAGDGLLRTVAQALQAAARKGDLVYRKGGEEFVVPLPGTDAAEAAAVGERLRSAIERLGASHRASATADVVTVTVGVATGDPRESASTDVLMKRAAAQVMAGKLAGARNRVHVWAAEIA